jgi:hypothetical protein
MWLGGCSIGDTGLAELQGLTSLQVLDIRGTKVTGAGVKELRKGLPKLKIVR